MPRVFHLAIFSLLLLPPASGFPFAGQQEEKIDFVDLSLPVASDYPATWPTGMPIFQINHYLRIGPSSPYNSDILVIDPNTGTQLDVPPHSIPEPGSGLPNEGPLGLAYTDTIPAWQFGGEACVVDVRELLDQSEPGHSSLIRKTHLLEWEAKHRPFQFGDVVLFHSGYSDRYYKRFPAGRRFVADPVEGKAPAWPGPHPEVMEYLASRKVMTLGTDGASMGPLPDLAEPSHLAGLQHGMIWTESATQLGRLPDRGAFYCMLFPKHRASPTSEGRAFAIVGDPLAGWLIERFREKKVVDLSVVLAQDLPVSWPGRGAGRHRQAYLRIPFGENPVVGKPSETHMLDSHSGTHLVPPTYALPHYPPNTKVKNYDSVVNAWIKDHERKYGPLPVSQTTADKVPIQQTSGWARVLDVRELVGTTRPESWPASPRVTPDHLRAFEQRSGELKAGEIVIFSSVYSDEKCTRQMPKGQSCMVDPLNGKSEGWPSVSAEAIVYLAEKGIRCVATDAPTLGGVNPRQALMTYWALGSRGMVAVEYLTNVGQLPERAYFLFAAAKVLGAHGAPGRAIAVHD